MHASGSLHTPKAILGITFGAQSLCIFRYLDPLGKHFGERLQPTACRRGHGAALIQEPSLEAAAPAHDLGQV